MLVKFTDRKWADKFISGDIYANSIYGFRQLYGDFGRGDFLEGCIKTINNKDFAKDKFMSGFDPELRANLVGNVQFIDEGFKFIKVFCLYNLNAKEIDERMLEFGDTCIEITNQDEFFYRMAYKLNTLDININEFKANIVNYYKFDCESQSLSPFNKLDKYSWQNEFRIAYYPGQSKSIFDAQPLKFNIGDISHITKVYDSREYIKNHNSKVFRVYK